MCVCGCADGYAVVVVVVVVVVVESAGTLQIY